LKKYLLVAAIGLVALVVAATATAQYTLPVLTFDGNLTPTNAGTKKKPKNSKIRITASIPPEARATVDQMVFNLPAHVRVNGKGFPTCPASELNNTKDPSKCPRRSRVGTGTVVVRVGNSTVNLNLTFFVGSRDELAVWVQAVGLPIQTALRGIVSRAGTPYFQKLTIDIPQNVTQPLPNVYANLTSLNATIGGHNGKRRKKRRNLITTVGCPASREHQYEARFRLIANPNPPAQGTITDTDTSSCTK
jgi:hypothetical protein